MRLVIALVIFSVIASAGYAPQNVPCPGGRLVREATEVSSEEANWVASRQKVTQNNLKTFLQGAHLEDFDVEQFLTELEEGNPISIGLAFSGGGYRAMLCGAGQMSALDSRTRGANEHGLGGLLQSTTYMTGLSGGSWLLGSVVSNNFTSIEDIIDGKLPIWDLSYSIFDGKASGISNLIKYYEQILADVALKIMAGFQATLTDIWGRALSHHFFGGLNFGDGLRWSDVQQMEDFNKFEMPFPIIVANAKTPGVSQVDANATIVEISPFELGSWDPSLNAFTQTKYLGTHVHDGMPVSQSCVVGFDNSGFVLGTSSTLFNEVFGQSFDKNVKSQMNQRDLKGARGQNETFQHDLKLYVDDSSGIDHTVAAYKINPFKHVKEAQLKDLTSDDMLGLVDGGEDLQNVPLYPLVQEARGVDVIFAYDNSADTSDDWPDGASMILTYQRLLMKQGTRMLVPKIPGSETFLALNYTQKPVFFGCNAMELDELKSKNEDVGGASPHSTTQRAGKKVAPLIVYTANRKYSFDSNKSTFRFVYDETMKLGMIRNGFETATRNNGTDDREWKTCVSCAIIRREQERRGIAQSEQCKKCFQEYCWREVTANNVSVSDSAPGKKPNRV